VQFLNPWGLLALLSLPALVVLYLLRQRHTEHVVSSIFLWRRTEAVLQASTPWQRLRKNLLMLLQLFMLLMLSLAVARPALGSAKLADEIIVILDGSASMRAADIGGGTRFDAALKEAGRLADGLRAGQRMSVIYAGPKLKVVTARSSDSRRIKDGLSALLCGYAGADIEKAVMLARGMAPENGSVSIVLYSDRRYEDTGGVSVVTLGEDGSHNAAVVNMSAGETEKGLLLMSTVASCGAERELMLELYCDGRLFDARSLVCPAGKNVNVYWDGIPVQTRTARVRIAGKDALADDDEGFFIFSKKRSRRILLASGQSLFIERAISAAGGGEIVKAKRDEAERLRGYDLYIYDGFVPGSLPEDGSVWLINPDRDVEGLKLGKSIKGAALTGEDTPSAMQLTNHMNVKSVALARFSEALSLTGWEVAIRCGKLPAVLTRESDGRRMVALLFDLHQSNLPLLKEFPILVQNMLEYAMPESVSGDGRYTAGEPVALRALPYSTRLEVTSPDGLVSRLAPPFPPAVYIPEGAPGVHTVTQLVEKPGGSESVTGAFTVSMPAGESALPRKGGSLAGGRGDGESAPGMFELWPYLAALALLAAVLEWWVYCRGR